MWLVGINCLGFWLRETEALARHRDVHSAADGKLLDHYAVLSVNLLKFLNSITSSKHYQNFRKMV